MSQAVVGPDGEPEPEPCLVGFSRVGFTAPSGRRATVRPAWSSRSTVVPVGKIDVALTHRDGAQAQIRSLPRSVAGLQPARSACAGTREVQDPLPDPAAQIGTGFQAKRVVRASVDPRHRHLGGHLR